MIVPAKKADERISSAFRGERSFCTVSGDDHRLIRKRQKAVTNTGEELVLIAAREVGPADTIGKECVSG